MLCAALAAAAMSDRVPVAVESHRGLKVGGSSKEGQGLAAEDRLYLFGGFDTGWLYMTNEAFSFGYGRARNAAAAAAAMADPLCAGSRAGGHWRRYRCAVTQA